MNPGRRRQGRTNPDGATNRTEIAAVMQHDQGSSTSAPERASRPAVWLSGPDPDGEWFAEFDWSASLSVWASVGPLLDRRARWFHQRGRTWVVPARQVDGLVQELTGARVIVVRAGVRPDAGLAARATRALVGAR